MDADRRCGMWIFLSVVSVIEKGSKVITGRDSGEDVRFVEHRKEKVSLS